jgi:hypothetical protein
MKCIMKGRYCVGALVGYQCHKLLLHQEDSEELTIGGDLLFAFQQECILERLMQTLCLMDLLTI